MHVPPWLGGLPMFSTLCYLADAPPPSPSPRLNLFRSPRVSMLPLKKCNGQHHTSSLGLTYASRMTLPIKSLVDVPPSMQWVPFSATLPHPSLSRLTKESSNPRVSMLSRKNMLMGNITPYPRARSFLLPDIAQQKARGCVSPHATSVFPWHLSPSLLVSACQRALEQACCLQKKVQWAILCLTP